MSQECVHHWIIETPAGRTSGGVCKHCGETRDFLNSIEFVAGFGGRDGRPDAAPEDQEVDAAPDTGPDEGQLAA